MRLRDRKKNGVIYNRRLFLCEKDMVDYLRKELHFPEVEQAAVLEKTGTDGSREAWYLLTSLPREQLEPQAFLDVSRKHWQIENGLHYVKDRTLQEDRYQGKISGLVECLTIVRNAVVTLFNQLTPPQTRKKSRPLDAIEFAYRPAKLLSRLASL